MELQHENGCLAAQLAAKQVKEAHNKYKIPIFSYSKLLQFLISMKTAVFSFAYASCCIAIGEIWSESLQANEVSYFNHKPRIEWPNQIFTQPKEDLEKISFFDSSWSFQRDILLRKITMSEIWR